MTDHEALEFEAIAMYEAARLDPSDPPGVDLLCRRLIGSAPRRAAMRGLADLTPFAGGYVLRVNKMARPDLVAFLVGHELAEWWFDRHGAAFASLAEREAACDALGARLACPGPAFALSVAILGHRVAELAQRFHVPRALSLLRVGEVTRRPVKLLGERARTRGDAFDWTSGRAHPIRLGDRWGMMAG